MILRHFIFTIILVNIVSVSCTQYGSLTFVIDHTLSMTEEIDAVKAAAGRIMNIVLNVTSSQIEDIVLVTFNDPESLTEVKAHTRKKQVFDAALRSIRVYGNGNYDCPEYSLSGVKLGLKESKRNSYLFVFTDAPPKDYNREHEIITLAQGRGSQIFFFLTKPTKACMYHDIMVYQPYYNIAHATYGEVFYLNSKSEVEMILKYLDLVISGEGNVIFSKEIPANQHAVIPFKVDDQTEYVSVSASGKHVELDIKTGPTRNYERLVWLSNTKILVLRNPLPGTYEAAVNGRTRTGIRIFGRTDFTFQHGFSETLPPTFRDEKKQPTEGTAYHLLIKVSDPSNSVVIQRAELHSADGKTLYRNLTLTKRESGDYYSTELFEPPHSLFEITIIGEGKRTAKTIRRSAKTLIEPRPRNIDPVINIKGGNTIYEYNNKVTLICSVHAYPPPEQIKWEDNNGNIIKSSKAQKQGKSDYISEYTIPNVKRNATYYCFSENELGEARKAVELFVKSPFDANNDVSEATASVEFGEPAVLRCNIKSHFKMKLVWYKIQNRSYSELSNSHEYSILNDGTELKINKVTEKDEGKYVCVAMLLEDKETRHEIRKEVRIEHVAPQMGPSKEIRLSENESGVIKCNILKAYPKPKVTWLFKSIGSERYIKPIGATGELQEISRVSFLFAGFHKCVAENDKGRGEQETKLIVLAKPKVEIFSTMDDINYNPNSNVVIQYNSNVSLICLVESYEYSIPNIIWKNSKNEVLNDKTDLLLPTVPTKNNKYTSSLKLPQLRRTETYLCEAKNELGVTSADVYVRVTSPFKVDSPNSVTDVVYGNKATIRCGISSSLPLQIIWSKLSPKGKRETIKPSHTYKISDDGSLLTINEVGVDSQGKYFCEASISDDLSTRETSETTVKIIGLAPQMGSSAEKQIIENETGTIICNILKAYPKPKVTWQFKRIGSDTYVPIERTGELLEISSVSLASAGVYKCVAENDKGRSEQETRVTVSVKPKVTVFANDNGKSRIDIHYRSNVSLNCRVVSHSLPKIMWKNSKNEVLNDKSDLLLPTVPTKNNEYTSSLKLSQLRRSETYHCEAKNELGVTSADVYVQVTSPFKVDSPNSVTDVKYGGIATIRCGIKQSSSLPLNIIWSRSSANGTRKVIVPSHIHKISEDGSLLTINKVVIDSQGKYFCEVSISDDASTKETFETTVKIIDIEPPVIDKHSSVIKVLRNKTAVIECNVLKGHPKPEIFWYTKKRKETAFFPLSTMVEEMNIPSAKYDDTGSYKCVASNVIGQDEHTTELLVQGPPEILSNENKTYTAVLGDVSLKIPCVAVGYPEPIVTWKTGTVTFSSREFDMDSDGTLIIKKLVEGEKNYTCIATNSFGSATKTFKSDVTEYIDDEIDESSTIYINLLVGETKDLNCEGGRWFKEFSPMDVRGTLILDNVKLYDEREGNYTCRVSDNSGTRSKHYVVQVGVPPVLIDPRSQTKDWHGESMVLSCEIYAYSNRGTTVEWFYNGAVLPFTSGDRLNPIKGWGNYSCKVSNFHGNVTKNFYVHSEGCLVNMDTKVTKSPLIMDVTTGGWPELVVRDHYYSLEHGQSLLFSCHNQSSNLNTFRSMPDKAEIVATCDHEDSFQVDDKMYKLSELQCKNDVAPQLLKTGEKCRENSELIKIGYNVRQSKPDFVSAYEVCFDESRKVPLYAEVKVEQRNPVRVDSGAWREEHIGKGGEKYCVNGSECCLVKRQLVDQLDVRHGPAQMATFNEDYNTVLYWRGCENINDTWDKIEDKVRSSRKPYTIWSGADGYSNKYGPLVPRYLWKIVKSRRNVAIVKVNDPEPTPEDKLCASICGSWDFQDEYTYCCKLADFKKVFSIPDGIV